MLMWRRLYVLPRLLPIHTCLHWAGQQTRRERAPPQGLHGADATQPLMQRFQPQAGVWQAQAGSHRIQHPPG